MTWIMGLPTATQTALRSLSNLKDDPVFVYVPSSGVSAISYGPSMVLGDVAVDSPTIELGSQQSGSTGQNP
jgi:hypothetical protein